MTLTEPIPRASSRVSVVGVGNVLYRDEGVGVYAAHYLGRAFRFAPEIDVADGALLGFGLMDFFQGPRTVVVLDALLADAPPGTIFRLGAERLLDLGDEIVPTAHEVDPIFLLKRARALGEQLDMVLLGIVPADARRLSLGLTPTLAEVFPRFVGAAVAEIRAHGVGAERVEVCSLDDIVDAVSRVA